MAAPTYTVTYDGNTADSTVKEYSDSGHAYGAEYTVLDNLEIEITKTGYVFIGWNTNADGTEDAYVPGDTITISGDVNLYAQWELVVIPTYTVTYHINNGPDDITYIVSGIALGDTHTIISNSVAAFENPGYGFTYWNTYPDGSGTQYEVGGIFIVSGDVHLYAQWDYSQSELSSIIYMEDDTTNNVLLVETVSLGSGYFFKGSEGIHNLIVKDGYRLLGWTDGQVDYLLGESVAISEREVFVYPIWEVEITYISYIGIPTYTQYVRVDTKYELLPGDVVNYSYNCYWQVEETSNTYIPGQIILVSEPLRLRLRPNVSRAPLMQARAYIGNTRLTLGTSLYANAADNIEDTEPDFTITGNAVLVAQWVDKDDSGNTKPPTDGGGNGGRDKDKGTDKPDDHNKGGGKDTVDFGGYVTIHEEDIPLANTLLEIIEGDNPYDIADTGKGRGVAPLVALAFSLQGLALCSIKWAKKD